MPAIALVLLRSKTAEDGAKEGILPGSTRILKQFMENILWTSLGIVTLILLIAYRGKRNAVWGGFTIGIIVGLVIALFSGFDWWIVGKSVIIGTLVGFGAELLGKLSDKMRR